MTDLTGQSIGRYQILEKLGEGGMAIVYKARDTRLDRDVALKLIRVDQFGSAILDQVLKRFEREAKSLARLSHPNIVTVHDYGEYENVPYLVLEYCPGGDLKSRLRGQPMDWREALQLILPVARALRYSHRQGVIHRDVKPSNVMFIGEDEPKLSDFGIAKILEDDNVATLTGTGVGIGTPGYMAPEQWTGETSPQSDQYGLGVVLYELLTGRKPYEADTPAGILIKQTSLPLPPPRQFAPAIPQAVEVAVLKALDRDPAMRHADMAGFIKAFEDLLQVTPVVAAVATVAVDAYKTLDEVAPEEKPQPIIPADWMTATDPLAKAKRPNWKAILIGAGGLIVLAAVIWGGWQLSKGGPFVPKPSATPTHAASATLTRPPSKTPTRTPTATEAYTPTATALPVEITDEKGVTMRLVPAGPFTMGSDAYANEQPVHTVTLDDYYMDVYEVTNAMYAACVDAGGCTQPYDTGSYTHSNYFRNSVYMNFPVIYVDWSQAKAFCEWRGAKLPTEAEWEKAARGTDGRIYPWGDANPSRSLLNYNEYFGDTTEVGSYESGISPYGMYDMAGNVWEWVNDWYDDYYYQSSLADNPQGPSSGSVRLMRGGSWYHSSTHARSASRMWNNPSDRNFYIGFRCSHSVPPTAAPADSTPQPTPAPVTNTLPDEIVDEKGVTMRLVPAGEFTMGSEWGSSDERPAHLVTLNDYYMDIYEVTNILYKACVDAGSCTRPYDESSYSRTGYYGNSQYDNYPVIYVNWNQAKTYCEWRGARLPSDAEWEKAARGTDGRIYPWGEKIDCNKANYLECGDDRMVFAGDTSEVGLFESGNSPYGLYDISGNVWEWVNDWYASGYYENSPTSNPQGPLSGSYRVVRGGAWNSAEGHMLVYKRNSADPSLIDNNSTIRNYSIGFRCAR